VVLLPCLRSPVVSTVYTRQNSPLLLLNYSHSNLGANPPECATSTHCYLLCLSSPVIVRARTPTVNGSYQFQLMAVARTYNTIPLGLPLDLGFAMLCALCTILCSREMGMAPSHSFFGTFCNNPLSWNANRDVSSARCYFYCWHNSGLWRNWGDRQPASSQRWGLASAPQGVKGRTSPFNVYDFCPLFEQVV